MRTQQNPPHKIHPQQGYGRSADARTACYFPASVDEMFIPVICPGIEEPAQLPRQWIEARDVGAFMQVAVVASQGEILARFVAAMLASDDVFDMKYQRLGELLNSAVLAVIPRPFANELAD